MTHSLTRRRRPIALLAGLAALAAACADDDDPVSQVRTPTVARFAPSAGSIPLPNDLLFSGSIDGTLNAPVATPVNPSDPTIALNSLDGASTSGPIIVEFTRGIDAATVIGGDTVRVFDVTAFVSVDFPVGGPVVAIDAELVAGTDFDVEVATEYPGGSAIRILPLRPLAPSTLGDNAVYMVVVTNGVRDVQGFAVSKDTEYIFASEETPYMPPTPPSLIQLQTLVNSHLTVLEASTGVTRDEVVATFTLTTQSVGSGLSTVLGIANGQEAAIIANLCAQLGTCGTDTGNSPFSTPEIRIAPAAMSIGTASELVGGAPGIADVYIGAFDAPYYNTAAVNMTFDMPTFDTAPLTSPWTARYQFNPLDTDQHVSRFNPLPLATGAESMPILITVPNTGPPPMGGWPVVIFQHGITRNRADVLGVAESFAAEGFACVSIDLPLHGVDQTTGQLVGANIFLGYQTGTLRERTFGLDLLTEPTGGLPSAGPDGTIDSSGAHYVNIANIAVTRDNVRQSVSDLINLRVALAGLALPAGAGGDVFDETNVHFAGHSLGGIVGAPYVALQAGVPGAELNAATIGMAGGGLPYLLNASPAFGPAFQGGLAGAGVMPGTPDYSTFLAVTQATLDTADPINYAASLGAISTPIYAIEIVGGGPQGGLPDLVVPNSVPGSPLAGTEPFVAQMGLTSITMTANDPMGIKGVVRFVEGIHGSMISPGTSAGELAAYLEIQGQLRSFHASNGVDLTVGNTAVVMQ